MLGPPTDQGLRQLRTMTDWKQYGGAPLLGFRQPMILAHPRSGKRAIANALRTGFRKWPSGIYFVWYPIKDDRFGQEIAAAALSAGFAEILQAEFCPHPRDGTSLAGSGVILCNPPWTIDEKLRLLCQELAPILGGDKGSWGVEWVRR